MGTAIGKKLAESYPVNSFRLMAAQARLGTAEGAVRTLQAAMDRREEEELLADFRRLESAYGNAKFKLGFLYVPAPELLTLVLALLLSFAIWAALRHTDLGKALRAAAEDGPIATAFGVNRQALALVLSGVCTALAGVAGVCIALSYTLAPAQIYGWIGVVFAAVMMGGLGRPLGPLVAGIVIGVSEAVTMAITSPSWAPLVSFSLLILVLLVRPRKV